MFFTVNPTCSETCSIICTGLSSIREVELEEDCGARSLEEVERSQLRERLGEHRPEKEI